MATSQVPGELSVAVRSYSMRLRLQVSPTSPQCQQSGPNGAEGSRSLRPTFHISSPVLSPNKHVTLPGTPTLGAKLTCPQDRKSKAGKTWPEPLLFQAAAFGGASLAAAGEGCPCSLPPALHRALPETGSAGSKLGPQHWDWHRASSLGLWRRACGLSGEAMYRVASRMAEICRGCELFLVSWPPSDPPWLKNDPSADHTSQPPHRHPQPQRHTSHT